MDRLTVKKLSATVEKLREEFLIKGAEEKDTYKAGRYFGVSAACCVVATALATGDLEAFSWPSARELLLGERLIGE